LRYMHSVVEVVDIGDVEQVIDVLVAFVRSLKAGDDFALKLYDPSPWWQPCKTCQKSTTAARISRPTGALPVRHTIRST
ncbi:MAG: hypothetical protein MK183_08680, partial [Verrucomicrobiales bacterium]|nr:hypothetical protein [Verrucomicrobiales bacterium]